MRERIVATLGLALLGACNPTTRPDPAPQPKAAQPAPTTGETTGKTTGETTGAARAPGACPDVLGMKAGEQVAQALTTSSPECQRQAFKTLEIPAMKPVDDCERAGSWSTPTVKVTPGSLRAGAEHLLVEVGQTHMCEDVMGCQGVSASILALERATGQARWTLLGGAIHAREGCAQRACGLELDDVDTDRNLSARLVEIAPGRHLVQLFKITPSGCNTERGMSVTAHLLATRGGKLHEIHHTTRHSAFYSSPCPPTREENATYTFNNGTVTLTEVVTCAPKQDVADCASDDRAPACAPSKRVTTFVVGADGVASPPSPLSR